MNDTPHSDPARARMQQIRGDIDQGLEEMVESARIMADWRHYVKAYPWVCLGTAVALGFLIVPKRCTTLRPDVATLTQWASTGQLVVKPTAMHGAFDALLATAANMAMRKATAYVGQRIGRLLGTDTGESGLPPADRASR